MLLQNKMYTNYKDSINFFYKFAKINGLAPFFYSTNPINVSNTRFSSIHSFIFGLLLAVCFLVQGILYISSEYNSSYSTNLQKFVTILTLSFGIIIVICVYIIQFTKRKSIVSVINEYISLWNLITLRYSKQNFFNSKFHKLYDLRKILLIIQVLFIVIVNGSYLPQIIWIFPPIYKLAWIIMIYSHVIISILSSFFYYGGIMTISHFYQILNDHLRLYKTKLSELQSEFKMNVCCELSDEFDYWSGIYDEITLLMKRTHGIFTLQVILIILCSFFQITITVMTAKKNV